ncbi:DEAD/DEAH box helicase [Rickettsia endosymbiont of Aspidapion aeneum]|uniref:DEAD/DEAH box helicase n=1 Tax=Rickettsia endosymbiont of Aspidapion aeneum TaxID=3066247 RepID=UPI00313DC754
MSFKKFYTTEDIINNFPDKDYLRGSAYAKQGYVKNLSFNNGKLLADVQGSRDEPYQVEVEIITGEDNSKIFEGICSCPVGFDCKHIVATLLEGKKLFSESPNIDSSAFDQNLNIWLESFKEADKKQLDSNSQNTLIYSLEFSRNHGTLTVSPTIAYIKKIGVFGSRKSCGLDTTWSYGRPNYINDNDLVILRLISGLTSTPSYSSRSSYTISGGEEVLFLLKLLIESERCYLKDEESPKNFLRFGETRSAKLIWKTQSDGTQTLNITVENITAPVILSLAPLHYICPISRKIGIVDIKLDIPDKQIIHLLKAPNIKPQQVEALTEKLISIFGNNAGELLPTKLPISKLDIEPIPILKLMGITIQPQKSNGWTARAIGEPVTVAAASLSFDYGGKIIACDDPSLEFSRFKGGEVQIIPRKISIEKGIMDYLQLLGFGIKYKNITNYYNIRKDYYDYITIGEKKENFHKDKIIAQAWEKFVKQDITRLKEQGWQIKMLPSFPYNIVYADKEWYGEIQDNDNQWFNVELGVSIEGNKLNLIPILLNLLKKDNNIYANLENFSNEKPFLIPLSDGKRLALPPERIKTLLSTIQYLFSFQNNIDENGILKMQFSEAALLAEMEAALQALNIRWFGGDKIRELGKKLKNFNSITPITIPPNFQGKLRNYQQEGLNWLQFLREYQLAGILADDMGLGKTVQLLAHIATEKAEKSLNNPFLVIAPTSLMSNWRLEAEKFVPDLKVLTLHGAKRKIHFNDISKYNLILTTYPLLLRDKDILLSHEYHTIILDEAQTIKNSNAKITQIVSQIKATHRVCLTGTPLENHLGELWSLFNFLLPGYLGTSKQFTTLFRNPIEKDGNNQKLKILTERIKPFILRRTKQEVLTELPPKTEIIRTVELEGAQRDLYETIRVSMHERVQKEIARHGMEKSHIIVLDALLKLRQVCCDPSLLKMDAAKNITESAKRLELINMLTEMLEEGRKILLFSQFTSMLQIIEEQLNLRGISYVKLTGQTKDRETPIRSFQEGSVPLFLISLKAGGTGLNLTAADTIIHYDPWWNPAVENQATDRAHRIGQDKPVFVYKIITAGTVEEKIIEMQKKKAELMNNLFDPTAQTSSKLTVDDISILFTPLTLY